MYVNAKTCHKLSLQAEQLPAASIKRHHLSGPQIHWTFGFWKATRSGGVLEMERMRVRGRIKRPLWILIRPIQTAKNVTFIPSRKALTSHWALASSSEDERSSTVFELHRPRG